MPRDLNKVMVIGRLGSEPEMRYTSQGSPVTTFRVAVNRQWRDTNGASHEDTEWFFIVAWNKLAELCSQYLAKGARVYLEGRLQTRSWEDQQSGQTRYKTEVIISDMILLDGRDERIGPPEVGVGEGPPWRSSTPPREIGDEDVPF